ncbi:MAG: hypothetical protein Q8Q49_01480 [bacterium]|nr:hypothetical protein [bacterium]
MDPSIQNLSKQTEVPVSEVPHEQPFSKKRHRIPFVFLALFILIVVGAFFGGIYYQGLSQNKKLAENTSSSPTPQSPSQKVAPNAKWETYTDGKKSFMFRYPVNRFKYSTEQDYDTGNYQENITLYEQEEEKNKDGVIRVPIPRGVSINIIVSSDGAEENFYTSLAQGEAIGTILLGETKVYLYQRFPPTIAPTVTLAPTGPDLWTYEGWIKKDAVIYKFVLETIEKPLSMEDIDMFQQILKTFTFVDQNQMTISPSAVDIGSKNRNLIRRTYARSILTAIKGYAADNDEILPPVITGTRQYISSSGANICSYVVPKYEATLTIDPSRDAGSGIKDCSKAYNTYYEIVKNSDGTLTVSAPLAELGETISFTQ